MSKIDASFIDDIFGIKADGSNITDDDGEAYASLGDAEKVKAEAAAATFEEKAKEVGAAIAKAVGDAPKISTEKQTEMKETTPPKGNKEDVEAAMKKAVPANPTSTKSMFGDIFDNEGVTPAPTQAEPTSSAKVEVKVETKVEPPKAEANPTPSTPTIKSTEVKAEPPRAAPVTKAAEDSGNNAQQQPSQPSAPLMIAGKPTKHRWLLDAPSPKYARFYLAKREALVDSLLKGGELPFDDYYRELEDANVDVSVGETFQPELVCQKMTLCQQLRERTKFIQLRVNRQFFQWERHMDLFEGLLSRIEYERGKQEGVKYEHMYDMESYFGELKSLHKSIDNVMRTLDSAFECLSRQVTVTMPIKDADRYSTGPKPFTPAMKGYDGLKTHANGGSPMGASQPKEAGTPAEPNQKKSGWDL